MKRLVLGLLCTVMLAGCAATPTFTKADTTPTQTSRDEYECSREAAEAVKVDRAVSLGVLGPFWWIAGTSQREQEAVRRCMQGRGYVVGAGGTR